MDSIEYNALNINKQYNLSIIFYSASSPELKYLGYVDGILKEGVEFKTASTCAVGHRIVFKIINGGNILIDGTGIVDSINKNNDAYFDVVCIFSQFSEADKQKLIKTAEINQDKVNAFMDDIS